MPVGGLTAELFIMVDLFQELPPEGIADRKVQKALYNIVLLDMRYFPYQELPHLFGYFVWLFAGNTGKWKGNHGIVAFKFFSGAVHGYISRADIRTVKAFYCLDDAILY